MKKKVLINSIIFGISMIALVIEIIFIEIFDYNVYSMMYIILPTIAIIFIYTISTFIVYYKGRDTIYKERKKIIDDKTPKTPIRFCPTDAELVISYNKAVEEALQKKPTKNDEDTKEAQTNDNDTKEQESEEMTL